MDQIRELRLTDGTPVRVDEEDFWRFWKVDLFMHNGYVCLRTEEGRIRRLHREVMNVRDHRIVRLLDSDPRNCTKMNLQALERSVLAQSRPAQGACKFKGVSPYRGKWQATIRVDGKLKWLGSFDSPEAAAVAYDDAVILYRGRSGILNFPKKTRRRAGGDKDDRPQA